MTFNTETGVVKLTANPDYETKSSYSFTVTASDAAGTSDPTTVTFAITDVDDTAPTVTNITAVENNGYYVAGDQINILVNFSENVVYTPSSGSLTLTLETGDNDAVVAYSSGSGGQSLVSHIRLLVELLIIRVLI